MNQIWRLFSGPALLLILPIFIGSETQGYWFTFVSLAALAVFADLGFTVIILQWSAHEFSQLSFDEEGKFSGNLNSLGRISSLFVFSVKWACFMLVIAFPIIFVIGYFLLSQKITNVNWHFPWFIYCVSSVLVFINNVVLSFFEGCNSVGDIQKTRLYIGVTSSVITIVGIISGIGLYALAIGLLISAIVGAFIIYLKYIGVIRQMLILYKFNNHNWKKDLSPLLWRYAISWASGYFIFQIFTPIAFHYYGAVEAGKVGLSIAALVAIYSIANIWMTIIIPKMNIYIANNDFKKLNILFRKNSILTIITYSLCVTIFLILMNLFGTMLGLSTRFVTMQSLFSLSFAWFLQIIVSSWAVYIRAHKKEPFVLATFVWAIYTLITTLAFAAYLPFKYYFLGFLSSYLVILPWFYYIFVNHKKDTHN